MRRKGQPIIAETAHFSKRPKMVVELFYGLLTEVFN